MAIAGVSAIEMMDVIEAGVNGDNYANGHTDAVAHVGMMLTGAKTPEQISDIQDEIENNKDGDYPAEYVRGYVEGWRAMYRMLF